MKRILGWIVFAGILAVLAIAGLKISHSGEQAVEPEGEVGTEVAVKTTSLVRATLHRKVSAYGVVEPAPASGDVPAAIARLSFPAPGLVEEVKCEAGKTVQAGDILVSLDTRVDQARLEQAEASMEFARQEYDRQKKLLSVNGASQKSVESAQSELDKARLEVAAAKTALALLRIQSPISGVVTQVNVRQGESADPSLIAVEVLDPGRVVVNAQIPAEFAGQIQRGQEAIFARNKVALPAHGEVTFVSPGVTQRSGSVKVLVSLPSRAGVMPGEWLEVQILTETKANVLAAPVASVTKTDEGTVVARVEGDQATQIPVSDGIRDGGMVEVQGEGLKEGDLVVTEGAYGLPAETKVRVMAP